MIMKGIFTYERWGMLQRFVGKLVEEMIPLEYDVPKNASFVGWSLQFQKHWFRNDFNIFAPGVQDGCVCTYDTEYYTYYTAAI